MARVSVCFGVYVLPVPILLFYGTKASPTSTLGREAALTAIQC
jgi:hypothetical protein